MCETILFLNKVLANNEWCTKHFQQTSHLNYWRHLNVWCRSMYADSRMYFYTHPCLGDTIQNFVINIYHFCQSGVILKKKSWNISCKMEHISRFNHSVVDDCKCVNMSYKLWTKKLSRLLGWWMLLLVHVFVHSSIMLNCDIYWMHSFESKSVKWIWGFSGNLTNALWIISI